MDFNFIDQIKKHTRQEWLDIYDARFRDLRIWIQEHGELSLVFGLLGGVIVVLAFQLVATILVLTAIILAGIWFLAPVDAAEKKVDSFPNKKIDEDGNG